MVTSIFLAKVIGFYIILKLALVWKNYNRLPALVDGFKTNDALRISFGLLIMIMGLLVVLSHNVWTWDFRGVITVVGWAVLGKGFLVAYSNAFLGATSALLYKKSTLIVLSLVSVIVAACLLSKAYGVPLI